jgi:RimJ/RimL family protein N-acetyltransferase
MSKLIYPIIVDSTLNHVAQKDMIDFDLILQTDKILLRPLISTDYLSFKKLTADQSMWIYFTRDLSVESELHDWVKTAVNDIKNKTRLAFTIIDKSTGITVGSTSLGNISLRDKRVEIGWTWLSKEYQGTGFNSQVKYLLIKYIFEVLDFERVEFKTDVLNIAARKALLRIGAKEEGVLRSHTLMTHGRRRDTIYYSILRSEWKKGRLVAVGI